MHQQLRNVLKYLADQALPGLCALCGQWLQGSPHPAVCPHCLRAVPWNTGACHRCGLREHPDDSTDCATLPFETTISPLLYQGPVPQWILRSKRRGGLPETRLLADCLAVAVSDSYQPEQLPRVLIPVPLSWRRLLRRGHNQALVLASMIGPRLSLPVDSRALLRQRHTPIQPGLSRRQRQTNMSNAFSCRRRWQGEHVAVIDDVMTSGATAAAIADCLLQAGCARVDVWCAARARSS
jgi:ComF family protein